MRLPTRKGKPKLPPTPRGGGAAARQRQFELERGLQPQPPLSGSGSDRASGEEGPEKEGKDK